MRKGFTLVELLVVIAIIGTITAILLPNFMGARERAADARKIQELGTLKDALRNYYNDNQGYPVPSDVANHIGLDSALISSYLPGVAQIGYTYYSVNTDTFQLCVGLDSGAGDEDLNSQRRCGATGVLGVCGLGTTIDKLYAVCAN